MNYRKMMEDMIGRKLETHEHVHHKDGDHFNDDPDNLQLCPTPKDHYGEHAWEQEELIDWLIQYNDEFGRFPTSRECNAHPGMPHSSTFVKRFGSWRLALRAAQEKNDLINYNHGGYDDEFDY